MGLKPENFAILYWGRRGGGLELFNQLVRDAKLESIDVIASLRPISRQKNYSGKQVSIFNVYRWIGARHNFKLKVKQDNIKTAIIVMASPWDIMMGKKLMKSGVEVVRIIHDGKPHTGEWFPTKFWIKCLTRDCSRIITLSTFVANQLVELYSVDRNKITISEFPKPLIDVGKIGETAPREKKRVLLIGRGKKYQGQELLEGAWKLMSHENVELVIAGKGFKRTSTQNEIIYKNSWMSNVKLIQEVKDADLVVFPYTEASQSGTIPICMTLGIPVLVTPVGGLPEQVLESLNGTVSKDLSPLSLSKHIQEILMSTPVFTDKSLQNEDIKRRLIKDCINEQEN